ncbi:hypothetical protein [Mesorhizobium sp. KR2-14]|uniref:hypothetical protein n=1 Tax=Mesorhizobium sp. KR2-14 TaxID=3156610 RepID=UPI0032B35B7B
MTVPRSDFYGNLTYHNSSPFAGAALKLKRAERHLHELADAARHLPLRRNYNFAIRPKPEDGQIEIIYTTDSRMPLEFAGVIGDAVHNIRSAFDYVAVALTAPPLGRGKAADAYFPTGIDRQEFIRARDGFTTAKGKRVRGKMEGASSHALRLVEELEPYDGGQYSLRSLHDLDVLDKHKLIIPAIVRLRVAKLDASLGQVRYSLGMTDFKPNKDRSNFVATVDCPADMTDEFQLDGEFQPTFDIVFAEGQPLEGKPVVDTLLEIADTGKRFIEKCSALFLRTN